MTIPTDAEIETVWSEVTSSSIWPDANDLQGFARAVLAKWGHPQAGSGGEPVYQASYKGRDWQDSSLQRFEYLKDPKLSSAKDWTLRVLYTAPPPQAVREPLTDEHIKSLCVQPWVFDTVKQWVRIIEAAHGISKGGQHGD